MSRFARIHRLTFVSLTLAAASAAWWGCASSNEETTTSTSSSSSSSSSGNGGSGGTGGSADIDGGSEEAGACASTSAEAHRVPLDIIFLIDRSGSMTGAKWIGTTTALTAFFDDPNSAGIGAGMVYFPTDEPYDCDPTHYAVLDVPIAGLPGNSFALTNSMPFDATGIGTPTWGALKGALMAATAYQDAHPTHKVAVVLASDGDPIGCGGKGIDESAILATSALNYNGVRTYVIAIQGSDIASLDKIAAAGGTTAAYDVTQDIDAFSAKMEEIRGVALGCDFEIPPPPNGKQLEPDEVNFTYTPKGVGTPKLLPRADSLVDCSDQPGWYYDNNAAPTKIVLCPASCTTVQADSNAKVSVLFGCKSVIN